VQLQLQLLRAPQMRMSTAPAQRLPFKDAALLARLAMEGPQPRASLAPWLWPQASPEGARSNLRQRVSRLQRSSNRSLLHVKDQDVLALQPTVEVDILQLAQALRADAQAAKGDLLGGRPSDEGPPSGESDLGAWLVQARDAIRAQRRAVLLERIEALEARQPREALAFAQRWVDEEPGQDEALCRLMQLHHVLGERTAALSAWRRDQRTRQREQLPPPGPQALALRSMIERADPPFDGPVAPAPPPAVSASLLRPPRLVGRSREWAAMSAAWEAGRSVLVQGHAGVGKTRLAEAFAQAHGIECRLAARPGDRLVPYALLGQLVQAATAEDAVLDDWARLELARLWPALGEAPAAPLQPLRLLQALRLLLRGAKPILIEDLHFADAASTELLPAVIEALPQALLSTRPDPLQPALAAWAQTGAVTTVPLSPWSAAGVKELLDVLALPRLEAARWTQPLMRHTGGHPLLLLGTLQALVRTPLPDPAQALPVPDRLSDLIAPRLQQLPPPALALARLAAFAGEAFSVALARACFDADAAALAEAWQGLDHAGLLGDGQRMHDLVAEAVRVHTAEPDAQAAHRRLAAALSARGAAAARVASHWSSAGEPGEAAPWHERAAREAQHRSRREEEAAQWHLASAARQRAGDEARAFEAGVQRLRVLLVSGNLAQADHQIEWLGAHAVSIRQQAQWMAGKAHAALLPGRFPDALSAAQQACALATSMGAADIQRDAELLAATAAAQLGDLALALHNLDAVDRSDQQVAPTPAQRLAAWSMRGHVLDRAGRCLEALAATERAIELASRLDDQTELIVLNSNAATLHAKLAQVPQALTQAREAMALAGRLGQADGLQAAALRMNLGVMAAAAGRYRTGIAELSEAMAQMARLGLQSYLAYAQHHLAMAWMMLGQPARAMRLLSPPVDDVPNTVRVRRLTLRGRLQRLCGVTVPGPDWRQFEIDGSVDPQVAENAHLERARTMAPEAAQRLANEVAARAETLGLRSAALHARLVLLDAALRQGLVDEAAERARTLMAELEHLHPTDVHWPELPWTAHRALAAAGCAQEADAALQAAHGWLQRALADEVDDAFRPGFVARNLVNRAVLAAWRRRG
jgi:DNA-binding SARP family transcriptional activator